VNLATFPILLFLISLVVAPQLWWGPVRDWRVDFIVYPGWMIFLAMRGRLGRVFTFGTQDWLMLGWVVWVTLSVILNPSIPKGPLLVFFYFKLFFVFRLVAASIADANQLRQAGFVFLMVVLLISIEGIQHAHSPTGRGWAGQTYSWIDERAAQIGLDARIRWVGIFDGPGVFCVLFTSAMPFAFKYLVPPYSVLVRILSFTVLTLPLLLAAYFTGSRGGILATAAIVGLFVLSRVRISMTKLIGAAAVGGLALMLAPSYLTDTRDPYGSAQHRVDMWAKGIAMVEENPVFGVGRGSFALHSGSLVAHNSGLEALAETGLVGFFLWAAVIYVGLRQVYIRRAESKDPMERETLLAVLLSLSGYLVSSLFVTLETELMYFLLGLTGCVAGWGGKQYGFSRREVFVVCGITFAYFVFFKLFVMGYY